MRSRVAVLILVSILVASCGSSTSSASASGTPDKTRVPTPSPTAEPTPFATEVAGLEATVLPLGADAAPIDILEAEGSVWVALHHGNAVALAEALDVLLPQPATRMLTRIKTATRLRTFYSSNCRTITVLLWPPNPMELERATRTSACRASLGT